jgi:hypothetical protein
MKNLFAVAALALVLVSAGLAQGAAKPEPGLSRDITGMYSFVREGEFVEIEVNGADVSGLISRFKDEDPDKAEFVNQFFEQGKLEGTTLSFRTKPAADGRWFEFSGTVERGPAKTPNDEGYWYVKGMLTEHRNVDGKADGKATEKVHELTLKSFPADSEEPNATGPETGKTNQKQ